MILTPLILAHWRFRLMDDRLLHQSYCFNFKLTGVRGVGSSFSAHKILLRRYCLLNKVPIKLWQVHSDPIDLMKNQTIYIALNSDFTEAINRIDL
jgi:hypothetical protein